VNHDYNRNQITLLVPHVPLVLQEPAIRALDPLFEPNLGLPAQSLQLGHIQQLLRRAIGLFQVLHDLAGKADHRFDHLGKFADGEVGARAHVHDLGVRVVLHQMDAGLGQVVHVQELAARRAGAPHDHMLGTSKLGFVELADEGGKHVAPLELEIVTGAVEVRRHQRDGVEAVLLAIGLAKLDAGDLGDGVPLVGWLQASGEEVLLLHRLRGELGVNAGAAQELELLAAVLPGRFDDVRLDQEVLAKEVNRVGLVGQDSAHLGCRHEDKFRLFCREEGIDGSGALQIYLMAIALQDVLEAGLVQGAHDGGADQPLMAGHKDLRMLFHLRHSCAPASGNIKAIRCMEKMSIP